MRNKGKEPTNVRNDSFGDGDEELIVMPGALQKG